MEPIVAVLIVDMAGTKEVAVRPWYSIPRIGETIVLPPEINTLNTILVLEVTYIVWGEMKSSYDSYHQTVSVVCKKLDPSLYTIHIDL
jgi:hypothetical protein